MHAGKCPSKREANGFDGRKYQMHAGKCPSKREANSFDGRKYPIGQPHSRRYQSDGNCVCCCAVVMWNRCCKGGLVFSHATTDQPQQASIVFDIQTPMLARANLSYSISMSVHTVCCCPTTPTHLTSFGWRRPMTGSTWRGK